MIPLLLSTASQKIILGPFLDSTDFNTEKTGLTIANTDIKLYKSGGSAQVNKNSGGATHDANGSYLATLDATDTGTLGPMKITVHVATALPVTLWTCVYSVNVYNSIVAATANLQVDTVKINSSATAAALQALLLNGGLIAFTVQASPAPTSNSFATEHTGSSFPDNCFKDKAIIWTSGSNITLRDCVATSSISTSGLVVGNANFPFTPAPGDTGLLVGVAS